jgi:hypothetical protein
MRAIYRKDCPVRSKGMLCQVGQHPSSSDQCLGSSNQHPDYTTVRKNLTPSSRQLEQRGQG